MTLHARWWILLALWLLAGLAQAGTRHYYYTDPQGTPLAKADANGTIIATYDYGPYGTAVVGMSGSPNGPGYTGHVNDPDTGLVYMQARYYDPAVGRFLSVDPVMPSPGNAFNFNRYAYANNNPIRFTDPDGKDTVGENIDSAAQGCGRITCAFYAVAHAAWTLTGAEPLSQVADKGWSNVSTGEKIGAVAAVAAVIPVGRIAGKLAEGAVGAEAAASAVKGSHTVYQGIDKAGDVRYVGITSRDVATRRAEHVAAGGGKEGLIFKAVDGGQGFGKQEARVMEQNLINQYGMGKNGGQLLNKINSISPKYWLENGITP